MTWRRFRWPLDLEQGQSIPRSSEVIRIEIIARPAGALIAASGDCSVQSHHNPPIESIAERMQRWPLQRLQSMTV
jgi:hypothetical protein